MVSIQEVVNKRVSVFWHSVDSGQCIRNWTQTFGENIQLSVLWAVLPNESSVQHRQVATPKARWSDPSIANRHTDHRE
jgi:hypothetical protein